MKKLLRKIPKPLDMKKILPILCFVLLTACGPSVEEKQQIEMEQQRIQQEAGKKLAQEKANRLAAVTCSIMSETRNMDAALRVEKMNDAREKIGGEPFLRGDNVIQEAFEWGLCEELVLNEVYDESLLSLRRERQRITAEIEAAKRKKERLIWEAGAEEREKERIASIKRQAKLEEDKRIAEEEAKALRVKKEIARRELQKLMRQDVIRKVGNYEPRVYNVKFFPPGQSWAHRVSEKLVRNTQDKYLFRVHHCSKTLKPMLFGATIILKGGFKKTIEPLLHNNRHDAGWVASCGTLNSLWFFLDVDEILLINESRNEDFSKLKLSKKDILELRINIIKPEIFDNKTLEDPVIFTWRNKN